MLFGFKRGCERSVRLQLSPGESQLGIWSSSVSVAKQRSLLWLLAVMFVINSLFSFYRIRQTLAISYNTGCLTCLPLATQPLPGKAFRKRPHIPQSNSPGHLQLAESLVANDWMHGASLSSTLWWVQLFKSGALSKCHSTAPKSIKGNDSGCKH